MKEYIINDKNIKMRYHDFPGQDTPIIFIHGLGSNPSWREILYSLKCSKTFIFGEKSLPDDDKDELARHGINIEVVENAGHSMAWENPKGLAEAIKRGVDLGVK